MFSISLRSACLHGHPLPFPQGGQRPFSSALASQAPEYPAHPSRRLWPRLLARGADGQEARLVPTFSWALLNFFCTCLAKRPAAPPALPSAILPAPLGWPAGAGSTVVFWRPPRRKCGFPACLASGPGGRTPYFPRGLLALRARPSEPTERPRDHAKAVLRPP